MEDEIVANFPEAKVELTKLSGGIFDVIANGKLIFSKDQMSRFPDPDEVLSELKDL